MHARADAGRCPVTGARGRPVKSITLKALLRPSALVALNPGAQYYFCPDPACDTVYFGGQRTFGRADVEVSVFAKDLGADVPVCYCFGWTRDRLRAAGATATTEIRRQVRAGRCGCEVNNPKGACCLGDVERVLRGVPAAH